MSNVYIEVMTSSGKIGRKVFENRVKAIEWVTENKEKISQAALVEEIIINEKKSEKKPCKKSDPKCKTKAKKGE